MVLWISVNRDNRSKVQKIQSLIVIDRQCAQTGGRLASADGPPVLVRIGVGKDSSTEDGADEIASPVGTV
jgi:hypothetical protein